MKLRSFAAYGVFGKFQCQLELSGKGLTFIHSPNGTGKSVFLRIINNVFNGNVEELADLPFQRFDAVFDDGSFLVVEKDDRGLTAGVVKNEVYEALCFDDVADMLDLVYLSPERNIIRMSDGHMVPAVEAYAMEFADRIVYWNDLAGFEYEPMDSDKTDSEVVEWCRDLKPRLDFIKNAGIDIRIPKDLKFPPSRYDLSKNRRDYVGFAHAAQKFSDEAYYFAESVSAFMDIVNGLFTGKSIKVHNGRTRIETDEGEILKLSKLSSGEKQIMVIFYRLLFHSRPGGMAIIDEPEISLHILWQHSVSDLFLDICRLRDMQIIAATHSPQMIHDKWDMAREMRMERV